MAETPADYELLAVFVAVADQASFSKAAKTLGIGKGTVSRAIARLERRVGAELLHRTTHTVALSTAGTALYERAAPHLAALDQAVRGLPERADEASGELRVTAPHDFAAIVLPELIAAFALRHPAIWLDVRVTNANVDLVAGGFDMAVRVSPGAMRDSTLTARKLGHTVIFWFASPSYVARRGEPRHFGDPKHDWIMFPPMLARTPKGFRARILADDFLLLRNLLHEGLGVGPLPRFVAERQLAAGGLVPVMPGETRIVKGGYYAVYPSSGQVPRKVIAFRDFLIERFEARPLDGAARLAKK